MITAITTLAGLAVIGVVAYFARMNKQARKFVSESADAVAAIGRGDLEAAKQIFERWVNAKSPSVVSAARHGLVIVLMRQSKVEQALELLTAANERTPSLVTATDFASCYALSGVIESAQLWLDTAQEHSSAETYAAMTAFPRAVVECRAGRPRDAARMLDERWADYEAKLNGQSLRILRVVRAFAHETAGEAVTLADARPAYAGEYDFLGTAWPEMDAFLARHDLT
jgi:hypothetical protein